MKILPKHTSLRPYIFFLLGLGAVLILFFPFTIAFVFQAHIVWLLLAVLLMFTPYGNKHAVSDATHAIKRLPFIKAVSLTFLLQITLFLAFYSICHLVEFDLPVGITSPLLFETMVPVLLGQWSLFPWGACALFAAAVGYTTYIKKQRGDMSTLLHPLLNTQIADSLSLILDMSTKVVIIATLAWTLGLLGLATAALIANYVGLPLAYGLRVDIMLALLVIFSYSKGTAFEAQMSWLLKHFSAVFVIVSVLFIMMGSFLLFSSLIGMFSPIFTPLIARTAEFVPQDWAAIWVVFSGIWWLGWVPLAGGMLAYVWRGYKIRTLIFWTLCLPVVATILLLEYPQWTLPAILNSTSLINLIPAIFSGAIIISIFLITRYITFVDKAIAPLPWRDYKRSPYTFPKMLLRFMLVMLLLYWMGGIYITGMMGFVVMYQAGLFVLVAGLVGWRIRG